MNALRLSVATLVALAALGTGPARAVDSPFSPGGGQAACAAPDPSAPKADGASPDGAANACGSPEVESMRREVADRLETLDRELDGMAGQGGDGGAAAPAPAVPVPATSAAPADPDLARLAPAGWRVGSIGELATFAFPDGSLVAGATRVADASDLSALAVRASRYASPDGSVEAERVAPDETAPSRKTLVTWTLGDAHFESMGLAVPDERGGALLCWFGLPFGAGVPSESSPFFSRCRDEAAGVDPSEWDVQDPGPPATSAPVPPAPPVAARSAVRAVVLDSRYFTGVGGYMYTEYYPITLYENGAALADGHGGSADGIDAYVAEHPDEVGRWRVEGSDYVVEWPGGSTGRWGLADGLDTFGEDVRLDEGYSSVGGGGDVAVGGGTSIALVSSYRFYRDGTYRGGSAVSATADVAAGGTSRTDVGRYRIDGTTLTLTDETGAVRRTTIVADEVAPPEQPGMVWIAGRSYL